MPIGSRSYYDSLEAAKKTAEAQAPLFGRGDRVVEAAATAAPPPPAEPPAAPAAPLQARAALPAKKRKPEEMNGAIAAGDRSARLDQVVTQIVELAGRASGVLTRAEELARRAEQMLTQAEDAAVRAEAGAMRAELAASRVELDIATAAVAGESAPEPAAEPDAEADDDDHQGDMLSMISERLRLGSEQLHWAGDPTPAPTAPSQAPTASAAAPQGIVSDFGAPEAPRAPIDETPRFSSAYRPVTYNQADALAHSLIASHEGEIPRVSPYIIHEMQGESAGPVASAEAA